jgi:hypothetical protein
VRSTSPRFTSSTSLSVLRLKASIPSRQDEADKSLGKGKDKSPRAKEAPAKKKSRVRNLSSSSSSSSDSGEGGSSDSDSSSREDEAIGGDEVLDRGIEEQLHVLKGKEAAHKKEKR